VNNASLAMSKCSHSTKRYQMPEKTKAPAKTRLCTQCLDYVTV